MYKVQYSPRSKEDLLKIKAYLTTQFSEDLAKEKIRKITTSIKSLEEFPLMGKPLGNLIDVSTDYFYFVIEKNYIFYRNEDKYVKIIRVLNHTQYFMRIIFGIIEISDNE